MNALRFLGRAIGAVCKSLWKGDLTTKLLVLIGLAVGVAFLGPAAGPVTTSLAQLLLVGAFLFAIYAVVLRQ